MRRDWGGEEPHDHCAYADKEDNSKISHPGYARVKIQRERS